MKTRSFLISVLSGALLQLTFAGCATGYKLLLPEVAAAPCEGFDGLPYTALADHYTGAACVQMVLASCARATDTRACYPQGDLYDAILRNNKEPQVWFSDPEGINQILNHPPQGSCGSWFASRPGTAKTAVLGDVLYYMRTYKYLTPVNIGTGEHWVDVIGFQTDFEPATTTAPVTLQYIRFYDPLPGNPSVGCISGATWLGVKPGSSGYWAKPIQLAGSAWNEHYVAVVEPPPAPVAVRLPAWRPEILRSPDAVLRSVLRWIAESLGPQPNLCLPGILSADLQVRLPILVRGDHPYYLVRFGDDRLAAVFSVSGAFEEIRRFDAPLPSLPAREAVVARLRETLRQRGFGVVTSGAPELVYQPEAGEAGRFSPTWEVRATVADASGVRRQAVLQTDAAGALLRGLEPVEIP